MRVKFLRGNTQKNDGITGSSGTITVDTEKPSIRLHDGVNPGGREFLPADSLLGLLKPVTDFKEDVLSFESVASAVATAQVNLQGGLASGSTLIPVDTLSNQNALAQNVVLTNTTDNDSVIIQSVDLGSGDITTTPTNKIWSDDAVLTTQSDADTGSGETCLVDITELLPSGLGSVSAVFGQILVREWNGSGLDGSVKAMVATPGEIATSGASSVCYPQVSGLWNSAGFTCKCSNNQLALSLDALPLDADVVINIQGYYK